ncbi:FtsX-like permease family protein [Albibacterium sp.]|uniref:FtsX-like permease family protein n=1 Tax=Albibacterium sp. TaxID=2952885 RepID=UPI002B8A8089|nr:FtsX-like permease family protein [Albibacterium sp.]HUH19898.1 FtsX-like permease family protein [Albibacterium sp.]
MNTPLFIAKRYLFSKKSVNAINIISGISTLGVLVGSAALIIILSVFNGFEMLILNMYSAFTPEMRVEPAQGKSFVTDSLLARKLNSDPRVLHYSEILQEKVLLRYGQNQYIAVLKGEVPDAKKSAISDSLINEGEYKLRDKNTNYAVVGAGVQAYLGINLEREDLVLSVYSPRKDAVNSINPAEEFNVRTIKPVGVVVAQPQFDDVVIVPISFAREVLSEYEKVSAIEIDLKSGIDQTEFKRELTELLGNNFLVKDRAQQNPTLYKVLNSEKWAIFLILTFVLIIAIFNIIGSLTMLVIDKKKDIAVLKSLGAGDSFIKNIFFAEGMFISLFGCIIGMALGLAFCILQKEFGLIKMEGIELVTSVFPVQIKVFDFILVFLTVTFISLIASFVSSRLSVKGEEQLS